LVQAEAAAEDAVAFAERINDLLNLVEAVRIQARVRMAQQRWVEAEQLLGGILARTQSSCYPWGEARVVDVYGLLHILQGEAEPARQRLDAALAIYRRLGAKKDVVRLEDALGGLSCSVPRPMQSPEGA
jgi:hypothetical protein